MCLQDALGIGLLGVSSVAAIFGSYFLSQKFNRKKGEKIEKRSV